MQLCFRKPRNKDVSEQVVQDESAEPPVLPTVSRARTKRAQPIVSSLTDASCLANETRA